MSSVSRVSRVTSVSVTHMREDRERLPDAATDSPIQAGTEVLRLRAWLNHSFSRVSQ